MWLFIYVNDSFVFQFTVHDPLQHLDVEFWVRLRYMCLVRLRGMSYSKDKNKVTLIRFCFGLSVMIVPMSKHHYLPYDIEMR